MPGRSDRRRAVGTAADGFGRETRGRHPERSYATLKEGVGCGRGGAASRRDDRAGAFGTGPSRLAAKEDQDVRPVDDTPARGDDVSVQALGLTTRRAVLVAVGSSICGRSAIAAVAPVIRAEKKDVASAVGLTAVIGVMLILALPLLIVPLALSTYQYGVLAGMAVYA